MRAAIYTRVSTPEQSTEIQEKTLRAQAAELGWEVVGVYTDHGISAGTGSLERRPKLQELLGAVGRNEVEAVMVWAVDRLTRSEKRLEQVLSTPGARLWIGSSRSLREPGTLESEIVTTIEQLSAAQWLVNHKRRTTEGRRAQLAKGRLPGGRPLYGYALTAERTWEIEPVHAAVVQRIYELVAARCNMNEVARILSIDGVPPPTARFKERGRWRRGGDAAQWHRSVIKTMVGNDTYWSGVYVANRETAQTVQVPALIPRELAEAARAAVRPTKPRANRGPRWFVARPLARCGLCGGLLAARGHTDGGRGIVRMYYRCKRREAFVPESRCTLPHFNAQALDEAVWQAMAAALCAAWPVIERAVRRGIEERIAETNQQDLVAEIEKKIVAAERRRTSALALANAGLLEADEAVRRVQSAQEDKTMLETQLAAVRDGTDEQALAAAMARLDALRENMMQDISVERCCQIAQLLVEPGGIRLYPDRRVEMELTIPMPAVGGVAVDLSSLG